MKIKQSLIAYNIDTNDIQIGPWPDETGWTEGYDEVIGANQPELHFVAPGLLSSAVLNYFNRIVVQGGVSVKVTHEAFLKLEEYWPARQVNPDGSIGEKPH